MQTGKHWHLEHLILFPVSARRIWQSLVLTHTFYIHLVGSSGSRHQPDDPDTMNPHFDYPADASNASNALDALAPGIEEHDNFLDGPMQSPPPADLSTGLEHYRMPRDSYFSPDRQSSPHASQYGDGGAWFRRSPSYSRSPSPDNFGPPDSDLIDEELDEFGEPLHREDSPEDEDPEEEQYIPLDGDPLFRTLDDMAPEGGNGGEDPDPEDDEDDTLPRAFTEDPLIRHTYIQVFIAASFHGATHQLCAEMLDTAFKQFCYLARQGRDIVGLDTMALTLRTAERRLGVDPECWIIYDFVCPACWYRYDAGTLYQLHSQVCIADGCEALVFTFKQLSNGKTKRVPSKILPRVSLIDMLQQILMRPGKYEEFQHWRNPGDEPGPAAPLVPPASGYDAFFDPTTRIYDIYDGWGWRTIQAGLERHRTGRWGVEDVDVHNVHQRFVSLPCGLVFIITVDW